jgi:KDO2-lipid IV(A) lauroyltransferase
MIARRRVARRNLEICFPELDGAARERLLRAHFRSLGMAVFEFLRAWWGPLRPVTPASTCRDWNTWRRRRPPGVA